MAHTGADVKPHDVAARVDRAGPGQGGAGEINRGELAPAQQKTMVQTGAHVKSHDVAFRVDRVRRGEGSISRALKTPRSERSQPAIADWERTPTKNRTAKPVLVLVVLCTV